MSDTIYTPYTYRITSKTTGQHYYGVRYAKGCNPDDLWIKYFTSSKYVHQLIEQYGKDDFIVEVRKTFLDSEKAREWEDEVINRMNMIRNPIWLNRNRGGKDWFYDGSRTGFTLSEEHKKAISRHQKGKIFSDEHRKNIGKAEIGNTKRAKNFRLFTPTGNIIEVYNLAKFCRENDLVVTTLHHGGTTKGYRIVE